MYKSSYHTHSTFCDGKNTPEEMLLSAVEKSFNALGFSSHIMLPFSSDWHLPLNRIDSYCTEINRLKNEYKNQLEVYLGFEADFIEGVTKPDFSVYRPYNPDFLIGSVHYVTSSSGKGYFEADGSFEEVHSKIQTLYKGNAKKAVQEYFYCQRQMLKQSSFTFLGHADLIRKQNSPKNSFGPLFDENASWYKKELKLLAKEISSSGTCVEINTGAMSRLYLSTPYPSLYFLELLHEKNVPVTINSDAHSSQAVDFAFDEAKKLCLSAGYKETARLNKTRLQFEKIDFD